MTRSANPRPRRINQTTLFVGLVCLVALVLASKGITNEDTVSLNGDMPRHMMNGVYFHDLISGGIPSDPIQYTYNYFAQYPALSLGHHPLLLPVVEAPFYALLGVSVFSARCAILFFLLVALISWFFLVRSEYDEWVAFASSLLLATSPSLISESRVVMTEIPSLSVIIVATYFFYRFTETESSKDLFIFVLAYALSCYAKQLSIFALPAFVIYYAARHGVRKLFSKPLLKAAGALFVLIAPLLLMTLWFSPMNVAWVAGSSEGPTASEWVANFIFPWKVLWNHQLAGLVVILAILGIVGSLWRRQKLARLFVPWIVFAYAMVVRIGLHDPRLMIYWVPAFCLFAALSYQLFEAKAWRALVSLLLVVAIGYQAVIAYSAEPDYAGGYEEAAAFVVDNPKGDTIMFSPSVDTGYFVFFVRKKDPSRQRIVLRANKILATSHFMSIAEERISTTEEIYALLDEYGTCYLVLEDMESQSAAQNMLREELKGSRFTLRREIPIRTNDSRLQGVALRIYEYGECGPGDPNAVLEMGLPMIGDSFSVRLGNILR